MYGYIYKITNRLNNKIYIGKHKYNKKELDKNYITSGTVIKDAINKYGIDNFIIELIDTAETLEELNNKEKYYIKLYDTYLGEGYNLTAGGDGHIGLPWNYGLNKYNNETIHNSSINSVKTKLQKYGNAYGVQNTILTKEHKENISNSLKTSQKAANQRNKTHQKQKELFSNSVWYNNGSEEKQIRYYEKIPTGWVKGRLINPFPSSKGIKRNLSTCEKIGNSKRNTVWINNGVVEHMVKNSTDIPNGFVKGRLKRNKSMVNS